jgi:hypothetical protein
MNRHWTIPAEPVTGEIAAHEGMILAYLAGLSTTEDPPEVPTIGGSGPRSKAMTTSLVFHLALCGHLHPRRRTVRQWFREKLRLAWRRWDLSCRNEPDGGIPLE